MSKEVTCPPCGATIHGEDDADLLANVRQHVTEHGHEMPAGMTEEQFNAHILSDAHEVAA
jgi:hypothetical protein